MKAAVSASGPSVSANNRLAAPANGQLAPELVKLRDGSSVTVRAVGPGDEAPMRAFLVGLCASSLRLRFFTAGANVADAAHWAACTPPDRYGLLAHDQAGVLVAHAVYVQLDRTRAEVAVEIADHLHGRGLGTILMQRIGAVAQARGITHFVASGTGSTRMSRYARGSTRSSSRPLPGDWRASVSGRNRSEPRVGCRFRCGE
jgi:GNAT superfamily N-acetyltransferase